ncbi:MAG: sigma-70 family RNA polymerase sigma factor [Clostridia bacterium]|nr:sigma-70 family RNA polymerase sigma factor [Clostridia bacterium]
MLAAPCEKQVYFTCLRMLGNQQDAEDCAQEAMLRAFHSFDSFRGDAAFSTWIIRIAMNCCNDFLRKQKNVVSLDGIQEESGFEAVDRAAGPYQQLESKERMRLLHAALKQLKEDYRQLIVLRDMQGFSYEELADTLKLSLGTVKSRLNRARKELSEILQKHAELFPFQNVQRNGGGKK